MAATATIFGVGATAALATGFGVDFLSAASIFALVWDNYALSSNTLRALSLSSVSFFAFSSAAFLAFSSASNFA